MNTHAEKSQENKSLSVANEVSRDQSGSGAILQNAGGNYAVQQRLPIQKKENKTGLPDPLKTGVEHLSGYSMDDVKVHYNSNKPAQLNAHAYAQGTDIHVASGQERHLPHEAWHVVQQKQGRVKPTMQMNSGVKINDDQGLEKEADVMGIKTMQMRRQPGKGNKSMQSGIGANTAQKKVFPFQFVRIQNQNVIQRVQHLWMLSPTGNPEFDQEIEKSKTEQDTRSQEYWAKQNQSKANPELLGLLTETKKDPSLIDPFTKVSEAAHKPHASDFSVKQKNYQAFLTDTLGLSTPQIMDYHQSAGYEFEFASFQEIKPSRKLKEEEELMPSHIILSESENLSSIFNLPFRLETDSGNSLEVVTPPFLFLFSAIPQKILSNVFQKYTTASNEINEVLKKTAIPISELGGILQEKDFGQGWKTKGGENLQAIPNQKHTSGAYGQINLSMTAEDIVEFLTDLSAEQKNLGMLNLAKDKSLSTRLLNEIDDILNKTYKGEDNKVRGGFLLYSRSVANLLAIPSILLRQQNLDYDKKPDPNYATQIKESLGLWIKANPHEVIIDYMKNLSDTDGYIKSIFDKEKDVISLFETYVNSNKGDIERWIVTKEESQFKVIYQEKSEAIKSMSLNKDPNATKAALEFIKWKKEAEKGWKEKAAKEFEYWHRVSMENIYGELTQLNKLINSGKNVKELHKTKFLSEKFGGGMGVRKDTFLPSTEGDKRKTYVSEIRGKEELEFYEKKHTTE